MEFDARVAAVAAERERVKRLEAATVSYIRPGDQQAEANFAYKSDPADRQAGRGANGRPNRTGTYRSLASRPYTATKDVARLF